MFWSIVHLENDLIMLILQLALGAFLLGGGIITLTNWIAEKLESNSIRGSR